MTTVIESIEIKKLIPTPDNPRFLNDPAKMAELVASIRTSGVLNPLLARPHPSKAGCFDLRAGSRRLAAAAQAGLKTVPVIVRELSDAEALMVTIAENKYEPLHPLEDAKGINALIAAGWTVDDIAQKLGQTCRWVARRHALVELAEPWAKAFVDPDQPAASWPSGIMELLARIPQATQLEAFKASKQRWQYAPPDRAEFDRWLNGDFLRELKHAPWKLDDETLYPAKGACSGCNRRSNCEPLLFEEDVPAGKKKTAAPDRCLDAGCWREKHKRMMSAAIATAKAEHGKALRLKCDDYHEARELSRVFSQKVLQGYEVGDKAKAGAAGAVPMLDLQSGKVEFYKERETYESQQRRKAAKARAQEGQPVPLKQLRKELQERRDAWLLEQLAGELYKLSERKHLDPGVDLGWDETSQFDRLIATFMQGPAGHWADKQTWAEFDGLDGHKAQSAICAAILGCWANRLGSGKPVSVRMYEAGRMLGELRDCAAVIKSAADVADPLGPRRAAAAKKFPEPKAWARLNEDGTPQGQTSGKKSGRGGEGESGNKPAKKAAKGKKKPAPMPAAKARKIKPPDRQPEYEPAERLEV